MKKIPKEAQVQMNGGEVYWADKYAVQCTTCHASYSSDSQSEVMNWGYRHHKAYYKKNEPHRWEYLRCG